MPMAIILAAVTPTRTTDFLIVNGVYVVDSSTHTSPQVFENVVIGSGGQATLRVLDGRLFRAIASCDVGEATGQPASGIGTIDVLGANSRLEVGQLTIGINLIFQFAVQGTGILNIADGGLVRADSLSMPTAILADARGDVTVRGAGSAFDVTGSLTLSEDPARDVAAIITIEPGGTVSIGTFINPNGSPEIRLQGGTLSLPSLGALPPQGIIQFGSGTFRFRSSGTLNGAAGFFTDTYGSPPVLATGRGLVLDGVTTLQTSLSIAGGSMRTTRFAVDPVTGSVLLSGGDLTLTGEGAVIDDGADFGPNPVTVGDGAGDPVRLELRGAGSVLLGDVTVLADGALSFSGEALVVDSLDNSGSVTVMEATLDARGGLVNTGSLRLAGVVVEGNVTSPAGSRIDVSGTVVFNGSFSGAATFYGSGTVIFNGGFSGPAAFGDTVTPIFEDLTLSH